MEEKRARRREADAASARERGAALAEDEKAQGRAISAASQRGERGSSYADRRARVEATLRRRQRLSPTSELVRLLTRERRRLSSLFTRRRRRGFESVAPAEELAKLRRDPKPSSIDRLTDRLTSPLGRVCL